MGRRRDAVLDDAARRHRIRLMGSVHVQLPVLLTQLRRERARGRPLDIRVGATGHTPSPIIDFHHYTGHGQAVHHVTHHGEKMTSNTSANPANESEVLKTFKEYLLASFSLDAKRVATYYDEPFMLVSSGGTLAMGCGRTLKLS